MYSNLYYLQYTNLFPSEKVFTKIKLAQSLFKTYTYWCSQLNNCITKRFLYQHLIIKRHSVKNCGLQYKTTQ